jgi:hypothetical protein
MTNNNLKTKNMVEFKAKSHHPKAGVKFDVHIA